MQRLVRFICSMFLFTLATIMANKQEPTELQEAIPQICMSCYTDAEQSTAERTMAHLYDEQIAIPLYSTGEFSSYHPTHSKPKCLQSAQRPNRNCILRSYIGPYHHQTPTHPHVIDYYIYTLEHILI